MTWKKKKKQVEEESMNDDLNGGDVLCRSKWIIYYIAIWLR